MLVYADLDTVEEISKPNCLVMRVEKKVTSLSVPRNLNTSCKGAASCNPGTLAEIHPEGESQVLSVPTGESLSTLPRHH